MRRVERPEPEPVPLGDEPPAPAPPPRARGLLRRVADAVRRGAPAARPVPPPLARQPQPATPDRPPLGLRNGASPAAAAPALASAVAAAGLGAVQQEGDSATVTFPAPTGVPEYVPFSTAPITVSREPDDDAAAAATATATAEPAAPAPTPPPAAPPGAGVDKAEDDEAFDRLLARLRRELLLEQEQRGQPFQEL